MRRPSRPRCAYPACASSYRPRPASAVRSAPCSNDPNVWGLSNVFVLVSGARQVADQVETDGSLWRRRSQTSQRCRVNTSPRHTEASPPTSFLLVKVKNGASAKDVAQLVTTTCFEIDIALSPIVGRRGLAGLLRRSLVLSGTRHPWLASCPETFDLNADLAALTTALSDQTPEMAANGGGLLLEEFHLLLTSLVGSSLTERLLRTVWANFLSGPSALDSPQ